MCLQLTPILSLSTTDRYIARMTPMMRQYHEAKAACGDALLFFRMGDFYELFLDDAKVAAKVLGLTLTSRDKDSDNPTAMAGFPHHQLDAYLHKLIQAGYRAAVCEQMEDPKQAKGIGQTRDHSCCQRGNTDRRRTA